MGSIEKRIADLERKIDNIASRLDKLDAIESAVRALLVAQLMCEIKEPENAENPDEARMRTNAIRTFCSITSVDFRKISDVSLENLTDGNVRVGIEYEDDDGDDETWRVIMNADCSDIVEFIFDDEEQEKNEDSSPGFGLFGFGDLFRSSCGDHGSSSLFKHHNKTLPGIRDEIVQEIIRLEDIYTRELAFSEKNVIHNTRNEICGLTESREDFCDTAFNIVRKCKFRLARGSTGRFIMEMMEDFIRARM